MASDNRAKLLANLIREQFMLERVAEVTGLPDFDDERSAALALSDDAASARIAELQAQIQTLRDSIPITRWVDADPQWRDATDSRINRH